MTPALATPQDQARIYIAARSRLWPSRLQFVEIVPPAKKLWSMPIVVEVSDKDERIMRVVRVVREVARTERVTLPRIIAITARVFDVSVADLLNRRRLNLFVVPRQIAMTVAQNHLEVTKGGNMHAVGRAFGRDHSTVHHAIQKYGADVEAAFSLTAAE